MNIKTVSIIGLGALGITFGNQLTKNMPEKAVRIVADQQRIDRYKKEGVYCNNELCNFYYVHSEEQVQPADLLIFAVKFNGLQSAIESARKHVRENTVILSILNGISSEQIIGETFGMEKMLYSVAQGMDAVKEGNQVTYQNMGMISFGEKNNAHTQRVQAVANLFEKVGIHYEIPSNMLLRMWSKFMFNAGVNQATAVFNSNYGEVQKEGEPRRVMMGAMQEVLALAQKEGIALTQADIDYWMNILAKLSPQGKTSMLQDAQAHRYSEVELFSGTVIKLCKKHGLPTPINDFLYSEIKAMESKY